MGQGWWQPSRWETVEARLVTEYPFIYFDFQTMDINYLFKNLNIKEKTQNKITTDSNQENKNNN